MSVSEETRKEMLREVFEYNATPIARPGDLTVTAVIEAAKLEGRSVSRTQVHKWLKAMVEAAGWETEMALVKGRQMRVWRKPESKD